MLGNNIRNIRKSKNISIKHISELTGITSSYLSMLENNKRENPSVEALQKIADALGVSVNEFFDDENTVKEYENPHNTNKVDVENSDKSIKKDLPIVPEEFTNADEARAYIDKHQIFGSSGFDADNLSDDEILEFANELLRQMEMISYKYKK